MKKKLSISIDEKMIQKIHESLKDTTYRNKSHLVEVALERLFEKRGGKLRR